jgi:hypothetical protein
MTLEIPVAQSVRNQNRLSSKADLEILSSFPKKEMNTKVGGNFVPYNQDTEFALFGVHSGRYGAVKEGLRIRKIWTRLILWKPSSLLSQGRSRARQGGARPKAPQGHKYTPLGAQGGVINPSIHQKAAEMKEKHREEADGRRVLVLPRRWLRPCPSHHGWPCMVKTWWSSGAAT